MESTSRLPQNHNDDFASREEPRARAMTEHGENRSDPVLALFRLYFGQDLTEYFLSDARCLQQQRDIMALAFRSASQDVFALRAVVAEKASRMRSGEAEPRLSWRRIKRAARRMGRWARGSVVGSWARLVGRGREAAPHTHQRQVRIAELFREAFPDGDWAHGCRHRPSFYGRYYEHVLALRLGRRRRGAGRERLVDDQLRWYFRADYVVANVTRLQRFSRQSSVQFSFQGWLARGPRDARSERMGAFGSLQRRMRDAGIFPPAAWGPDEDESPPRSLEGARRASRYLAAVIIEASIPADEWDELLLEMQALVGRLKDPHRNNNICAVRELL